MTATGYLAGDPTKLNKAGYTKGNVVAADGTGTLTALPVGADALVLTADHLTTRGVDWEPGGGGGGGTPSGTVVTEQAYGQAATAGIVAPYSRGDHTHGTMATPTATTVGLGNVDNTSDVNKPISTATQTALNGKQPLDSDLTTIAGLVATTDNFIQSKASAWSSRTPAQVAADVQGSITIAESQVTNLVTDLGNKQPLDSDLTTIAGLTATTDNFMQSKSSAWASRTPAQVATDLQAAGLAPLASPTFTGTASFSGREVVPSDSLTDAATIATDASLGNYFRCTLNVAGATRLLGNPTNPTDGQKIIWELIQDGSGNRALTLDTKFALGTDITAVTLSTTASKRDFVGAIYNSTADKWYIVAFVKGY